MNARTTARSGFSYIEVMVAMAIFAAAAGSVVSMLSYLMKTTNNSARSTEAVALAHEILNEMATQGYDNLTSGYRRGYKIDAKWSVAQLDTNVRELIVEVAWDRLGSGENPYRVSTLVAQRLLGEREVELPPPGSGASGPPNSGGGTGGDTGGDVGGGTDPGDSGGPPGQTKPKKK